MPGAVWVSALKAARRFPASRFSGVAVNRKRSAVVRCWLLAVLVLGLTAPLGFGVAYAHDPNPYDCGGTFKVYGTINGMTITGNPCLSVFFWSGANRAEWDVKFSGSGVNQQICMWLKGLNNDGTAAEGWHLTHCPVMNFGSPFHDNNGYTFNAIGSDLHALVAFTATGSSSEIGTVGMQGATTAATFVGAPAGVSDTGTAEAGGSCPSWNLWCQIVHAFKYLFVPSGALATKWGTFNDLAQSKPPFSLVSSVRGFISSVKDGLDCGTGGCVGDPAYDNNGNDILCSAGGAIGSNSGNIQAPRICLQQGFSFVRGLGYNVWWDIMRLIIRAALWIGFALIIWGRVNAAFGAKPEGAESDN